MEINLQVPFVLLPRIFPPPIAGCAPGTGSGKHFSAQTLKNKAGWATRMQFKFCRNGRAKTSKARRSVETLVLFFWMENSVTIAVGFRHAHRAQKPLHLKLSRTVCIHQKR